MPVIQKTISRNLSDILGTCGLEVPKYQRSYSWQGQQVDEFLTDLFDCFEREVPWFLGIFYTYPRNPSDESSDRMVLDGQQRLTTVFILLKEMMLFYENVVDGKTKEKVKYEAVKELNLRIFMPASNTPWLSLDIANRDKFTEYLRGDSWESAEIHYVPKTDIFASSHRLVNGAIADTRKRLTDFYKKIGNDDEVLRRFQSLVHFVLLQIELIEIQVSGNETIYQIFENINDRGLHLSDSDKFKNLYCSLINEAEIHAFEQQWFQLNRTAHSIDLDVDKDFFFFYFRSKGENDSGKFYKTIRPKIADLHSNFEKRKLVKSVFKEVEDMVRAARAVKEVRLIALYEGTPNELLKRISKVVSVIVHVAWKTSQQFRILVYSSYFAFTKRRDPAAFQVFLLNLMNAVRFYVSAALQKVRGNAVRDPIIEIAGLVKTGSTVATAVRSTDRLNFPDRLSKKRIDTLSFNDNNLSILCLLLIQASKNVEPIRQHDAAQSWSLEHFVPKKYEDNWNQLADDNFKTKYAQGKYNLGEAITVDDLRKKNKHRIQEFLGNKFYMDLDQNKLGNNKAFKDKKDQYIKYGKPITMPNFEPFLTIDEYSSFGIKDILVRTNDLYDFLIPELKSVDPITLKLK